MKRLLVVVMVLALTGCGSVGGMLSAGGYVGDVYVSGAVVQAPPQPVYYQPVYPAYQPVYPSHVPPPAACGPRRGTYHTQIRCNSPYYR